MKNKLKLLSLTLRKLSQNMASDAVERFSDTIDEEWDTSIEESLLAEKNPDKAIRETSRYKGWMLPGEEIDHSMPLGWLFDTLKQHGRRLALKEQDITSNFLKALTILGSGSEPKYLGHGLYGVVWDIGSDHILKVAPSHSETKAVSVSREFTFEELPYGVSEVMILASGMFPDSDTSISWKIMEKLISDREMEEINPSLFSELDEAIEVLRAYITSEYYLDNKLYELIRDKVKKSNSRIDSSPRHIFIANLMRDEYIMSLIDDFTLSAIIFLEAQNFNALYRTGLDEFKAKFGKTFNLVDDWFERMVKSMIVSEITGRKDMHVGNVGIRPSTGTMVFFDA